jgi:hypothetical protein
VSEETGKVSVATFGEIEIDVPLERVENLLSDRADPREKRSVAALPRHSGAVPQPTSAVRQPTVDR